MDILQAKEEIKRTIKIYLEKDNLGEYVIPHMKQRPIFMIGAPGIGKTAVVEQVAEEMNIGLVSYSMTHHTRQSAIGLPYISMYSFDGEEVRVSEYTMSEILAEVYRMRENSGKKQGILFLDEINCVSETLAPAILQFLQYKTFGNRMLPEGWVIVSAGNPPEYNRSVREFDIATRLKYIRVKEDYDIWKKYAYDRHIHPAIMSFLEVNKTGFYSVKVTPEGSEYATARGWEDLSLAMKSYEASDFDVDLSLIEQYIKDTSIARKFGVFYELYVKYRENYKIDRILAGKLTKEIEKRAKEAPFDERIAVTEMLCAALNTDFSAVMEKQAVLESIAPPLREVKDFIAGGIAGGTQLADLIEMTVKNAREQQLSKSKANALSKAESRIYLQRINVLTGYAQRMHSAENGEKIFAEIKKEFEAAVKEQEAEAARTGRELENVFAFIEKVWVTGRELMYFMTVLTAGKESSSFIAEHGSEGFYRHNDSMLVYDVREDLKKEIQDNI